MRVKPVPSPPDSLDTLEAARQAVPLVPGGEDDCCARIMNRIDVPSRDDARTWLTFLRGLGLVEEGPRGFVRTRVEVDLSTAVREGIFGANELLEILDDADRPMDSSAVFERFTIPAYERHRHQDPDTEWRERVRRLLDWLVLVGEVQRTAEGYVRD